MCYSVCVCVCVYVCVFVVTECCCCCTDVACVGLVNGWSTSSMCPVCVCVCVCAQVNVSGAGSLIDDQVSSLRFCPCV